MEHGVRRVLIPMGFSFFVLYALNLCVWQLLKTRAQKNTVEETEDINDESGQGEAQEQGL